MTALSLAARRSLARVMRRWLIVILLAAGATGLVGIWLSGAGWSPVAEVAVAVLAAGGLMGVLVIEGLSRKIAQIAVRPIELLLNQPGATDQLSPGLNWQRGRALGRDEIEADLAILHRQMRGLARKSRATIEELERARAQADQQIVAKSHFLANMSHELRTPLNAILGYAMLLEEDATEVGNTSAVADLSRIQHAGRKLLALINDILDLAKIDAGKAVINRSVIDIRALAEASIASCADGERNGNRFELIVSDDVGIMIGDAAKVRQCLLNLLGNAFKFTSDGSIALIIEPASTGPAQKICFSVRDTGIGIDESRLENLFDAFNQVEPGSTRRFGGTGLGLAITRRLARMMGGDCIVESVQGAGSTFKLLLPLSPHEEGHAEAAQPEPSQRRSLPVRNSDRTALLIEDDEAASELMQRWLERMGYDVVEAGDGEAGLALAKDHRPNLIILDALLPGRSGYDILKDLRADPALNLTPVIVVTVDDDRARVLEAGASDYLRKPVSEDQLKAAVDVYRVKTAGDILVIEDDDDAAELIRRGVEQIGFTTRRANDGVQGLEMAARIRPAAIVLDLAMPGLDGFGVLDRLAADESLAQVPLIVLSGCEISLNQHRALATGGHRFFAKGASSPREIAQSLKELVG